MKRDYKKLDVLFEALASEHRREIIHQLAFSPSTISQLATNRNLSLPAIHKHMDALQKAKLIDRKKVGRSNLIALNPESLVLAQNWVNKYQTHWGSRLATLENYAGSNMNIDQHRTDVISKGKGEDVGNQSK